MPWHVFLFIASNAERFAARELLRIMLGTHWEVKQHEKLEIEALAYPWQVREGPAFVQSPGGIWVPPNEDTRE